MRSELQETKTTVRAKDGIATPRPTTATLGAHVSSVLAPVTDRTARLTTTTLGAHASSVLATAANQTSKMNKTRKTASSASRPALSLQHDPPFTGEDITAVPRLLNSRQHNSRQHKHANRGLLAFCNYFVVAYHPIPASTDSSIAAVASSVSPVFITGVSVSSRRPRGNGPALFSRRITALRVSALNAAPIRAAVTSYASTAVRGRCSPRFRTDKKLGKNSAISAEQCCPRPQRK